MFFDPFYLFLSLKFKETTAYNLTLNEAYSSFLYTGWIWFDLISFQLTKQNKIKNLFSLLEFNS